MHKIIVVQKCWFVIVFQIHCAASRLARKYLPPTRPLLPRCNDNRASTMKLATTLFVDIVGFSKGKTEWQAKALSDIGSKLRSCPTFITCEHAKEALAITSGDGFAVAFFGNPYHALICAKEFRQAISLVDYSVRMALNEGDIEIVKTDVSGNQNLSGSSVNIAARILEHTRPGELLLTAHTKDLFVQVEGDARNFRYVGQRTAKWNVGLDLYRLIFPAERHENGRAARLVAKALAAGKTDLADVGLVRWRLKQIALASIASLIAVSTSVMILRPIRQTPLATHLRQFAYETLIGLRSQPSALPVTVIDVAGLPRHLAFPDIPTPDNEEIVDRDALRKVLESVARRGPKSVGVDIDLGRFRSGPAQGDGALLQSARAISKHTPLFLGLRRSINLYKNPNHLFFDPNNPDASYGQMPVHPAHPPANAADLEKASEEIIAQYADPESPNKTLTISLPSLSSKVAASNPTPTPYLAKREEMFQAGLIRTPAFLVDYSIVPRLLQGENLIHVRSADDLVGAGQLIAGHMVLIGSTDLDNGDVWWMPGGSGQVPGVFWQAAAAYTKSDHPLYELDQSALDWFSALAGLFVLAPGLYYRKNDLVAPKILGHSKLRFALSVLAAISVALSAWLLASRWNLLWLDLPLFAIVCIALTAIIRQLRIVEPIK